MGDGRILARRPSAAIRLRARRPARPVEEGNVGAGAGATIGNSGMANAMKGGSGRVVAFELARRPHRRVRWSRSTALAMSSTRKRHGLVAGVTGQDGKSVCRCAPVAGAIGRQALSRPGENTTIGRRRDKRRIDQGSSDQGSPQMAHDGFARAIYPAHTMGDGDAIFALATGAIGHERCVSASGPLAADAMAEAILRAVRAANREFPDIRQPATFS